MARDFDYFPTYDPVIQDEVYLSSVWSDFMATFVESLRGYLSSYGAFVPVISLADRNAIQTPQEGQMVYVSDAASQSNLRTAQLQIWLVTDNVGSWTVIV